MVKISELQDIDTISVALKSIGDSLFDQKVNQPEILQALGEKYQERANVVTISPDSELVGMCAYYDNDPQSAFISMLVINSGFQHQGYGTKLLREVIRRCRQKDIRCIRLEVDGENQKAVDFYVKNGFRMQKENRDKLIMELELKGGQ